MKAQTVVEWRRKAMCVWLLLLCVLSWSSEVVAQTPKVRGSVVTQFANLRRTSELIGFEIGSAPDTGYINVGDLDHRKCHWQGVARHPDPTARVFYLSRSAPDGSLGEDDYHTGNIAAVLVDSADVSVGNRIRSNLLKPDTDAIDTDPWSTDKVIWTFEVPYKHPGAMQITGKYLVVDVKDRLDALSTTAPSPGVAVFDISSPRAPQFIYYLNAGESSGSMGILQLDDGRYLMASGTGANVTGVNFRLSSPSDLQSLETATAITWSASDHTSVPWPVIERTNTYGYFDPPPAVVAELDDLNALTSSIDASQAYYSFQALNLVQGEDGSLYMIGTMNLNGWSPFVLPTADTTPDCAALYSVQLTRDQDGGLQAVTLQFLAVNYFRIPDIYPFYPLGLLTTGCRQEAIDFNAGGAAYVSPAGDLFLYSTSHYNRYQDSFGIKHRKPSYIGEIAPLSIANPGPLANSATYVALYQDVGFGNKGIVFDGVDSNLENWNNLGQIEDFDNKTSSLIVRLPSGVTLKLYEDNNYGGRVITMTGTGSPQYVPNISNLTWDNGETDVNEKISSLRIIPDRNRTLFVSDERTSEAAVYDDFLTAYPLLPGDPGSILKVNGPRTIKLPSGTNVLNRPMQIRAFGGSVLFGKQ